MYIWERSNWPHFDWQEESVKPRLNRVRLLQGRLLGRADALPADTDREAEMDALIQNAIRTSEIEGESLNAASVRSSVVRHWGLEQAGVPNQATAQTDALVGLLLDATQNYEQPLTLQRLCDWQAALFPKGSGLLRPIRVGELRGEQPMQVVSGRIDRPEVHFEAPPRGHLEAELEAFLEWFNHPPKELDLLLRAGITHLWFITIHPFDDGNGRVARALTDMTLAQAEEQSIRFYSLSAAVMARRREYYKHLEAAQKGGLDITSWLVWFLDVLESALEQALDRFERVLAKSRFWQVHGQTPLNDRQIKVINRLLDRAGEEFPDGINASKYKSIAKTSKATATRDLADLLEKGCIRKLPGGGRSTRYVLNDL